jgi:hypothetical protein
MGPFMQTRRLSAVHCLDITVANRCRITSVQLRGSFHSSETVSAEDGWFRYRTVYRWGEEEESNLGIIIGGLQKQKSKEKSMDRSMYCILPRADGSDEPHDSFFLLESQQPKEGGHSQVMSPDGCSQSSVQSHASFVSDNSEGIFNLEDCE